MANTDPRRRPFVYQLASDGEGKFAAFREEEPIFLFIRDSEAAAVVVAEDTIVDYVSRFG